MASSAYRLAMVVAGFGCVSAFGASVTGNLYYSNYTGSPNVYTASFAYDGTSFSIGASTALLSLPGAADGIILAPNGDLLIGGQHQARVYQYNIGSASIVASPLTDASGTEGSFHLSLNNNGTAVYTSNAYDSFGTGALMELPIVSGLVTQGTRHAITAGPDTKINTTLWVPAVTCSGPSICAGTGMYYYINDAGDNGHGSFGAINVPTWASLTTTRIFSGYDSTHSLAWDPYTNLITFFGLGRVGTWDPISAPGAPSQRNIGGDFDQGVVDGHGHALIAGGGQITFIDYAATRDITSALNPVFQVSGYTNIDDVLALFDATEAPEPGSMLLMGTALALGLLGRKHLRP